MSASDKFAESSRKRFEVGEAKEVKMGIGGSFKAESIGTLSASSGPGDEGNVG